MESFSIIKIGLWSSKKKFNSYLHQTELSEFSDCTKIKAFDCFILSSKTLSVALHNKCRFK